MSSAFDLIYEHPPGEESHSLWRAAYGTEYPEELAILSFLTRSELRVIADAARGDTLVDLGCGRGGPGIAVARETGALLVGVDTCSTALGVARAAADRAGMSGAMFIEAGIQDTGLGDACTDVAISVDVVQLVPDRARTFGEVARIVRPGGHFCFTTWDITDPRFELHEPISDQRPLLEDAGFAIVRYEEPDGWRARHAALYEHALAREDELVELPAIALAAEARAMADRLADMRRVLCVAERR